MNFRPLIGYMIFEGVALMLLAVELWGIHQLKFGVDVFIVGMVTGIVIGIPISMAAWNYIAGVLSNHKALTAKDSKKLFGPNKFQWIFLLLIFHVFFYPLENRSGFLSVYVFAGGVLSGGASVYFLFLIVRVLLREHTLRHKIIIRVG